MVNTSTGTTTNHTINDADYLKAVEQIARPVIRDFNDHKSKDTSAATFKEVITNEKYSTKLIDHKTGQVTGLRIDTSKIPGPNPFQFGRQERISKRAQFKATIEKLTTGLDNAELNGFLPKNAADNAISQSGNIVTLDVLGYNIITAISESILSPKDIETQIKAKQQEYNAAAAELEKKAKEAKQQRIDGSYELSAKARETLAEGERKASEVANTSYDAEYNSLMGTAARESVSKQNTALNAPIGPVTFGGISREFTKEGPNGTKVAMGLTESIDTLKSELQALEAVRDAATLDPSKRNIRVTPDSRDKVKAIIDKLPDFGGAARGLFVNKDNFDLMKVGAELTPAAVDTMVNAVTGKDMVTYRADLSKAITNWRNVIKSYDRVQTAQVERVTTIKDGERDSAALQWLIVGKDEIQATYGNNHKRLKATGEAFEKEFESAAAPIVHMLQGEIDVRQGMLKQLETQAQGIKDMHLQEYASEGKIVKKQAAGKVEENKQKVEEVKAPYVQQAQSMRKQSWSQWRSKSAPEQTLYTDKIKADQKTKTEIDEITGQSKFDPEKMRASLFERLRNNLAGSQGRS